MIKKLIPAYILSFVIAFTIFIYEPIILYASNQNDLWFDFMTMIKPITILFLSALIALIVIYTILKLVSKKDKLYNIILIVSFVIYFASYIQGNYLLKDLPGLDGTTIIWKGFFLQNLTTILIWIIIISAYIVSIKKFKIEKVIKASGKVVLVVFVMLLASTASTLFTTRKMFMKKYPVVVTDENYLNFSTNKNFVIFLIDAADSRKFSKTMENSEYKDLLKDFTYYPDTASYFLFTRDSIPLILTGKVNQNEDDYYTYYNKAFDESKLIDELNNKNYDINIYDHELIWTTDKSNVVKNKREVSNKIIISHFAKCNLKFVGYKYLPYFLKKYAKIEKMDFNYSKNLDDEVTPYAWDDIANYQMLLNYNFTKDIKKQFKFVHVNGVHSPYNIDENLNRISDKEGTYEQEILASLKLLKTYIDLLKQNKVYDNSVFIVMADHGYSNSNRLERVNPILYIKGLNETHDKTNVSNAKTSHIDLVDAYIDLLNDKKSSELFKNIPADRIRKFIAYKFTKEDHMVEYKITGHVWETHKFYKTGKVYNR